jgi:hypothetical protein
MSVDFSPETLLSLTEAAALLPGRPHVSTLHRWRLRGVRGVKLLACNLLSNLNDLLARWNWGCPARAAPEGLSSLLGMGGLVLLLANVLGQLLPVERMLMSPRIQ